jgi:hypothetical protein
MFRVGLRTYVGAHREIQKLINGILKTISNLYPDAARIYKENKQEL